MSERSLSAGRKDEIALHTAVNRAGLARPMRHSARDNSSLAMIDTASGASLLRHEHRQQSRVRKAGPLRRSHHTHCRAPGTRTATDHRVLRTAIVSV